MRILYVFLVLVMLLSIFQKSIAQTTDFSEKIKFSTFQTWAQSQNIAGYSYAESAQEGDAEYGEEVTYRAEYKSQDGGMAVNLASLASFSSYTMMTKKEGAEIFKINNYDAVYIPMEAQYSSAFFVVKIPEIFATVTIMAMPLKSKTEMETIFKSLKISDLIGTSTEQTAAWADEIPQDARINADIISINKKNASTDGVAYEYEVKVVMNDKLVKELERIMSKYNGSLTITNADNFMIVCADAESIEDLKNYKKNGDPVSFIYYKKN